MKTLIKKRFHCRNYTLKGEFYTFLIELARPFQLNEISVILS